SKETVRLPPARRENTTVRELGAHDGSSPATNGVIEPPPAGTTQTSKSPARRVKMICLPSGDQSGSVQFAAPTVLKRRIAPPLAGTRYSAAAPPARDEKQIVWP